MADQKEQEQGSDQVDGRISERCGTCRIKNKSDKVSVHCKECERRWKNESEFRKGEHSQFDMNGLDICQTHKKRFEFFCQTHQEFSCSSCFFKTHRDCKNMQELQSFAKSVVTKDAKHMVDGLVKDVQVITNGILTDIVDANSDIGNQVDMLQASLKDMKDSIVKRFDDLSDQITKQANIVKEQKATHFEQKTKAIIDMSKQVHMCSDFLSATLANGSQTEKAIAMRLIRQRIASVKLDIMKQQDELTNFHFALKYNPMLTEMLTDDDKIAKLYIDETCMDTDTPNLGRSFRLVIQASMKVTSKPGRNACMCFGLPPYTNRHTRVCYMHLSPTSLNLT